MSLLIEAAAEFAKMKHAGQLDDTGANYFEAHILQVVNILKSVTSNEEILAAAYLHDIVEDTHITVTDLAGEFGHRVAMLVWEITHVGHKDSKGFFFPNLHSKEAVMIKFADRLSNLSRMKTWNEKRQAQYLRKSVFWSK
jgi:GTP pyrophosphokinase